MSDETRGPAGECPRGEGEGAAALTRREIRAIGPERRRHPILRGIVIALVCVLSVVAGGSVVALFKLNGNIKALEISSGLLRPKAQVSTDPTSGKAAANILLMGVDSRAGSNAVYGDAADARSGMRSDTTMLVHLAADRRSAVVVSIPRDTVMPGPPVLRSASGGRSSASSTGPSAPPGCDIHAPVTTWDSRRMFNENITLGGIDCVVATVMQNTGLSIDHVATVDFSGFKQIVNAMGSVPICVTKPVSDPLSGLRLTAGWHELNGEESLAFVRTRHGVGDGSDIGRMRLQQDFAAAVVRKATSTGVLLNPAKMYGVMDAATKALSTDPELAGGRGLSSLALELREMKPADIRFLTAPTEPYPRDPNRLQLSPAATQLWTLLRNDAPWPGTPGSTPPSATPTPSAIPTLSPSTVSLSVENASGADGLATQVAKALRAQGFVITATGPAGRVADGYVIHHSPAQLAQAKELALALPGATLKSDGAPGAALRVVVGRGTRPVLAVPNRLGTGPLPAQPIEAPPATGSGAGTPAAPTEAPTLQAKSAADDVCSDTSKGAAG
ncbi:LCP family protein [Arsenicicoccus dermatophilus]|uniref:LCP family protein n=1 Tax=Arsenicicoccus dermatophilus TaxID=1076331 RepID=UPI003916F7A8